MKVGGRKLKRQTHSRHPEKSQWLAKRVRSYGLEWTRRKSVDQPGFREGGGLGSRGIVETKMKGEETVGFGVSLETGWKELSGGQVKRCSRSASDGTGGGRSNDQAVTRKRNRVGGE